MEDCTEKLTELIELFTLFGCLERILLEQGFQEGALTDWDELIAFVLIVRDAISLFRH
jgi:hypothetical protein